MRKQIAVTMTVVSLLTTAAPALASTTPTERPATTSTSAIETRPVEAESVLQLRRFCTANPDHERCARPENVNVRQMIWRLIKAGEWRQLFQLLQRLGII